MRCWTLSSLSKLVTISIRESGWLIPSRHQRRFSPVGSPSPCSRLLANLSQQIRRTHLSKPSVGSLCRRGPPSQVTYYHWYPCKRMTELILTSFTPFSAKATADGFEGSLAIPMIWNCSAERGSLRTELMTDPPWLPVAPKTTRLFLDDILYLSCWKCKI
jgi:hypothetical protein